MDNYLFKIFIYKIKEVLFMAKELGGYGPTAGESMGGTGANLNQQGGGNNSGVHWGGGSGHGNGGDNGNTNSNNTYTENKVIIGWVDAISNNHPEIPDSVYVDGEIRINITDGVVRTPVYGVHPDGKGGFINGSIPSNPTDKLATIWDANNLPEVFEANVDGFKYRVQINNRGVATTVARTGVRPYTKTEKAKAGIMEKINHKTQNEIYEALGFNKDEPQRQDEAKKQAQNAWKKLPPNVRKFNVDIESFRYLVTLNDYGSILSVKRIAVRPYTKTEKAKAGIMEKINHKSQEEIYEALGFNVNESIRQDKAKNAAQDVFNSFKVNRDRIQSEVLNKAADTMITFGEKIGAFLGEKFKSLYREIAGDITNFQGKRIRNYDQAIESLNKVLSNPGLKVSAADRKALANAWRSMNAHSMAENLKNISRAFKTADILSKAEKVRTLSIEGYETGNWSPLVLEVESWVLSGIISSVALAILTTILGSVISSTALALLGITVASLISLIIDARRTEQINNLIRSI